jgi:hypothetical protein
MNGNEIVAAVEKLHATYPTESVEIWTRIDAQGREHYIAMVGEYGKEPGAASNWGDHPMIAAAKLIAKAGKRDPIAAADAKIAKLREELARLEAAQQPVVMEA